MKFCHFCPNPKTGIRTIKVNGKELNVCEECSSSFNFELLNPYITKVQDMVSVADGFSPYYAGRINAINAVINQKLLWKPSLPDFVKELTGKDISSEPDISRLLKMKEKLIEDATHLQ